LPGFVSFNSLFDGSVAPRILALAHGGIVMPMTRKQLALGLAVSLFAGSCGEDNPVVKNGTWGGLGTELNVTGSGASVKTCCNGTGTIQEPLTPDASGHFKARGVYDISSYPADYEGTVSGDSMQLKITAYPPTSPGGVVVISPTGSDYRGLIYGVGFIERDTSTNPPVGCVCGT
jgi:hypothetical protein